MQRRRNCFRCKVAAMKPKAQPRHRQDSRQAKDAGAARSRMETWPTRHPRMTASPACALTRLGQCPSSKVRALLPQLAATCLMRDVESPHRGQVVYRNHPPWHIGNEPPAPRAAPFRATCHGQPRLHKHIAPIFLSKLDGIQYFCKAPFKKPITRQIRMKRKYITEFAIGYMNSYTSMVTAHQLLKGGTLKDDDRENLSKCHIYIIAARPSPYFDPDSIVHKDNKLSGVICYKIDGEEKRVEFDEYPWELEDDAVSLECKYPFKEINSINPEGKEVTYLPASFLATAHSNCYPNNPSDLNKYEVLYVGQALGDQGNRSALDRLRSHSTLQKILAMTNYDYPDKEIMIFMYQFDHAQMLTSMDGMAKDADKSDRNESRLMHAMQNPPEKKQKIGMIEAGLIRYFKPHYNEIFKIKFPSVKHKVLKSCYSLDISGLAIELNSSDLNYFFYSESTPLKSHHIAQIDLVSSQNRMSFFSATAFPNNPEVIK